MAYQAVFKRKEMKYLLTAQQYQRLMKELADRIVPDDFPVSAISNLYYDTPDFRLIRTSLQKPKYKEKLRLRCYKVPNADTQAFLEIKKKAMGIVYKRRESLPYRRALDYLAGKGPGGDSQIFRELEQAGGEFPFDDKASPEQIREKFGISKAAFKRAVGHLLKEGKIVLLDGCIRKADGD